MTLNKDKRFPARPRLPSPLYSGTKRYFITINTYGRERIFVNDYNFQSVKNVLVKTCENGRFLLWAFCFMPDHVHLFLEGIKIDSDLQRFIKIFKQMSGYTFKKQTGKKLWSTSFYDHILRKEECAVEVIKYILNNPVRKGLVSLWYEYSYSGSFELEKEELL